MFRLTIGLLIVAVLAAIFGFGGLAAGFASVAKIIFFIALGLLVLNLIFGGFKRVS